MFRVLAIDGGGIRGVIPAHWLDRIRKKLGTNSLASHFDLIVGTSTGSLLSAAIALNLPGDNHESRLASIYKKNGKRIFQGKNVSDYIWDLPYVSPQYDHDDLGSCLKEVFSNGVVLGDAVCNLCITSYDVYTRNPFIMRSYDSATAHIKVWEACKASCSAPTYFSAHPLEVDGAEKILVDGGVVANNPAAYALSEAVDILRSESFVEAAKNNEIKILSLGTGNLVRPISKEEAVSWGMIQWAKPIIDVIMDGSSASVHEICRTILSNDGYIRLQCELKGVSDNLDEVGDTNLQNLVNLASSSFSSFEEDGKIDKVIDWLSS